MSPNPCMTQGLKEPALTQCLLDKSNNVNFGDSWKYNTTPATPPPPHNQNVSNSINGLTYALIILACMVVLAALVIWVAQNMLLHRGTRVKGG